MVLIVQHAANQETLRALWKELAAERELLPSRPGLPPGVDLMVAMTMSIVWRGIMRIPVYADEVDAVERAAEQVHAWNMLTGRDPNHERRQRWVSVVRTIEVVPLEARREAFLTLGGRIRQARQRLGVAQADLALACGVATSTVYRWEHDEARPDRNSRRALSEYLHYPMAYLNPLETE